MTNRELDDEVLFVLVHGTFAPNAPWTQAGSVLRQRIEAVCGKNGRRVSFETVNWSGANWSASRRAASVTLTRLIASSRHHEIFVVSHSHGGSVVALMCKSAPQVAARLSGGVFLSTPFYALRGRPTNELSILSTSISLLLIIFISSCAVALVVLANLSNRLGYDFGGATWAGIVFLSVLAFVIGALKLSKRAAPRIEALVRRRRRDHETSVLPEGRWLFVRSSGDEAALVLAFAQFLAMFAGRLFDWTGLAFVGLSRVLIRARRSHYGLVAIFWLLATYSMWVTILLMGVMFLGPAYVLEGYDSGVQISTGLAYVDAIQLWALFLFWYPFLAITLTLVVFVAVQIAAWIIGALALLGFGWFGALDPLFVDYSIEPLPRGLHSFLHVHWADKNQIGLNHSQTYCDAQSLHGVEHWLSIEIAGLAAARSGRTLQNNEGVRAP